MRYRITVNAAGLEDGTAEQPILVEHLASGRVHEAVEVELGPSRIVYGVPTQAGARVWIEADNVYIVR